MITISHVSRNQEAMPLSGGCPWGPSTLYSPLQPGWVGTDSGMLNSQLERLAWSQEPWAGELVDLKTLSSARTRGGSNPTYNDLRCRMFFVHSWLHGWPNFRHISAVVLPGSKDAGEAGEMAQCLPHKHEDLTSTHNTQRKADGGGTVTLAPGGWKPNELVSSRFNESACLKRQCGEWLKKTSGFVL